MALIPEGKIVWGVQLPVQTLTESRREPWELTGQVRDIVRVAQAVDQAGGFFVGVCDHIAIPDNDYSRRLSAQWYDPIATLSYLAACTTNVRLLTNVFIAGYRHPLSSAKQFMTLDRLSGGRAIAGVGAGHVEAEFDALGLDFRARGTLLNEAIDAMRDSFANERTSYTGQHFDYKDMQQAPRPVQERLPIWVGGGTKPALRRVAERGDGWIPQGNPRTTIPAAVDYIRAHRDKVRPGVPLDLGFFPESMYLGRPWFDVNSKPHLTGSPDYIAASLREAQTLGCNVLHVNFRSRSAEEYADQIAAFARDVWPLVESN